MTEREKFEKWFAETGLQEYQCSNSEMASLRNFSWIVWKAATKAAVPEWIPVSERLPEFKHGCYEYLVLTDGKVQHDYFNCPFSGGDYFEPFWNHYGERVTHWMPLPEQPEVK